MSIIKKQTILSSIYSYLGVGVGVITQLFFIPHFLSKEENGLLGLLLAYTYTIIQLANLGFNAAGGRFFTYFRNYEKKHNGYLFLGIMTSVLGFLLCSTILLIFKDFFISSNEGKSHLFKDYYWVLFVISFFMLFFNVFDNYARGLFDTVWGTFFSQFLQRFLVMCSLIFVAFKLVDFPVFIWIWIAAISLPTLLMFVRASQMQGFSLKPDFSFFKTEHKSEYLKYSALSAFTGLSSIIINQLDKILVHKYLGLAETGVYNTSLLFTSVMGMSLIAMNKASSSIIIDALNLQDYKKVGIIYSKSCLTQLALGGLLFIGVCVNIDTILTILPSDYSEAKWVIMLLCFGKLIDLATGVNGMILAYSKHFRLDAILMISFVFVLYVMNSFFIPTWHLIGASMAAVIAMTYYNSVRTFLVWKKFGLQPFSLATFKLLGLIVATMILGLFLPKISGSFILTLVDLVYRSAVVSMVFVVGLYYTKASEEINGMLDAGLKLVKLKR
jgi:O-antigen/teichoic acid export membrane protein